MGYENDKYGYDAKVVKSKTLPECETESKEPFGKSGPLVAKIPVVIAEPKIQIDVESEIKLEEPALEIKRIKKNVFLTQCKLIVIWDDKDDKWDDKYDEKYDDKYDKKEKYDYEYYNPKIDKYDSKYDPRYDKKYDKDYKYEKDCKCEKDFKHDKKDFKHDDIKFGKLFISGFVRKNIEYSTINNKCLEKGCLSGDIRHTTCNVPFDCVAKVKFVNPPEIRKSGGVSEVEIFSTKFNICDPCGQAILGRDGCEQDFKHFEAFTERAYCELEFAKIFEEDIHKDVVPLGRDCSYEHAFDTFTEKMVIFLKLKILQNQQVKIPFFFDPKKY